MSEDNAKKSDYQHAVDFLRSKIKPGDTLYTVLRSVSKSGMSRKLDVYAVIDGEICKLTWYAKHALGYSQRDISDGLRVNGCGMDMGFDTVYCLSRVLFPDNPKRSDNDGGYALKQRWM